MSDALRRKVEARIRKQEAEIAQLRHSLESAEAILREQKDMLAMVLKASTETDAGEGLRKGSMVAKAFDFLERHAKPAHISEILIGIGKANSLENRRGLSASLNAYCRKQEIFSKIGPNIYGLLSWGEQVDTNWQAETASNGKTVA